MGPVVRPEARVVPVVVVRDQEAGKVTTENDHPVRVVLMAKDVPKVNKQP